MTLSLIFIRKARVARMRGRVVAAQQVRPAFGAAALQLADSLFSRKERSECPDLPFWHFSNNFAVVITRDFHIALDFDRTR